jgi:component of IIS longevity pathway SMK-1
MMNPLAFLHCTVQAPNSPAETCDTAAPSSPSTAPPPAEPEHDADSTVVTNEPPAADPTAVTAPAPKPAAATAGPVDPWRVTIDPSSNRAYAVIELLSGFVGQHGYRIRYLMLGKGLVRTVLAFTEHRERHIAISAVRFLRALVGAKDEFYNRSVWLEHTLLH